MLQLGKLASVGRISGDVLRPKQDASTRQPQRTHSSLDAGTSKNESASLSLR